MSGAHEGRCEIKADGQVFLCEFAGQTLPKKGKNQDRFGMKFAGNALTVGIFDGHSVHDAKAGIKHAENACTHLTKELHMQARHPILCPLGPAGGNRLSCGTRGAVQGGSGQDPGAGGQLGAVQYGGGELCQVPGEGAGRVREQGREDTIGQEGRAGEGVG